MVTHLGGLGIGSLEDMAQQQLGVLGHDGARERIALVGPEIMALSPPSTNQLLKIGARIEFLVIRREVVENLRRSMDAGWRCTDV